MLASAIGAKWGVPLGSVPWLPDVERPKPLSELVEILRPDRVPDRVYACSVTGLSGLGKTSLTAAYSQEYADAYDFILWIESESIDTIRASIAGILDQAQDRAFPVAADDTSLRRTFHGFLAAHPGTWLAIFDGALDPKMTNPWLPARGNGHVIVTSTNSTVGTQLPQLSLDSMTETEALSLVRLRLERRVKHASAATPTLIDMVNELERWPLALEFACAYVLSTGLEVCDIPAYIRTLRTRALADETLVLLSYPRTLVAAIELCLERIAERADPKNLADSHYVALLVVQVIAYLTSRRIPVQLALSCALVSEEAKLRLGCGAAVILPANVEPREVVRVLMSQSLVTADRASGPPPSADAPAGVLGTAWTVSTNEVIQEVIRLRTDADAAVPALLSRIAFHVKDWLFGYLEDRDFPRLAIVEPHATAVVGHVQRLRLGSLAVALLLGNLAAAYRLRGLLEEATDLLEGELAMVERMGMGPSILHVKIHQELARLRADAFMPAEDVLRPIAAALDCIRAGAVAPASIVMQLDDMRGVVHQLEGRHVVVDVTPLRAELDCLLATAGSHGLNDATFAIQRLIAEGQDDEAFARTNALLAVSDLPIEQRLSFAGLRLECLAYLKRWSDAQEALETLAAGFDQTGYLAAVVFDSVLNGALAAQSAVLRRDAQAVAFFLEAMTIADRVMHSTSAALRAGPLARHAALRGLAAVVRGDAHAAREAIAAFKSEDLTLVDARWTAAYEMLHGVTQRWLDEHG